jgi:hypothetical protein
MSFWSFWPLYGGFWHFSSSDNLSGMGFQHEKRPEMNLRGMNSRKKA